MDVHLRAVIEPEGWGGGGGGGVPDTRLCDGAVCDAQTGCFCRAMRLSVAAKIPVAAPLLHRPSSIVTLPMQERPGSQSLWRNLGKPWMVVPGKPYSMLCINL
jgi:hypothetical protein